MNNDKLRETKKIEKSVIVKQIPCDDNISVTNFMTTLQSVIDQSKKQGITNLNIQVRGDEGDENNLPRTYLVIYGRRIETNEEWHKRLLEHKSFLSREVESIERDKLHVNDLKKEIENIEKSLKKIPKSLRCSKCGNPKSYIVYGGIWGDKEVRVCRDCDNKNEVIRPS